MQAPTTFDMPRMLREMGGDPARLVALASSVGGEIPHHILTMRENLGAGRLDGLEFAARYLGMLFDSLLAKSASDAARDLEDAARRRQLGETRTAFESLEDEVEALLEDFAEIRSRRGTLLALLRLGCEDHARHPKHPFFELGIDLALMAGAANRRQHVGFDCCEALERRGVGDQTEAFDFAPQ